MTPTLPNTQTPLCLERGATCGRRGQSTGLSPDEEAKLVYGVVLSSKDMLKELSGKYVPPILYFSRGDGS